MDNNDQVIVGTDMVDIRKSVHKVCDALEDPTMDKILVFKIVCEEPYPCSDIFIENMLQNMKVEKRKDMAEILSILKQFRPDIYKKYTTIPILSSN